MRVLYIGKFIYHHSTENYVTYALKQHGCEVRQLEVSTMKSFQYTKEIIQRFKPDFILFSKPEPVEAASILAYCAGHGIPTVCWQWDLFFGHETRSQKKLPYQFLSDLLMTTDGGHQKEFETYGFNHQVLRQGIHQPDAKRIQSSRHLWDVMFVGASEFGVHPSRTELVNWLQSTYGDRFKLVNDCRGMDLNRKLSKAAIVVGDSYPTETGHYWSNRIYEILGRGGFLLHPETAGLDEEFEAGTHYVSYRRGNFSELRDLISHYLTFPSLREAIQARGHEYTKTRLTYIHRVAELLGKVRKMLPDA